MRNDDDITRVGRTPQFPPRLGPCRLLRSIGEGGMGSVYLGELLEPRRYGAVGDQVAIKVLRPDIHADAQSYLRFQREAELGTAVDHVAVVKTHEAEVAEVDGKTYCFLIMEYVDGRTLAQLLDLLEVLPEALCRDIAVQVAQGLDAIHEVGAVHRDLKPSNIVLTPDHRVKLMDLGIALVTDEASRMTRLGDFVGTLHYASPEQFGDAPVTPAADLYSLGVVLLEAATGQQPFAASEFATVMRRHLDLRPEKAGTVNPQVSPFLEEVVATLLLKDPSARFGSAAALVGVLQEAESGAWWSAREQGLRAENPDGGLRRMRSPSPTPCVGRSLELDGLQEAWRSAGRGEGSFVFLEGEAGVGKSRLLDEFLERVEEETGSHSFLHGTHSPGQVAGGRAALRSSLLGFLGESHLARGLQKYMEGMTRLVPAFSAWLKGTAPPSGSEALTPEALDTAFCRIASSMARERPTVWVVEDLHFATPGDVERLFSMARIVRDKKLLLVASTRPGYAQEELANLQRATKVHHLRLGRLATEDIIGILRESGGTETVARELGGLIASRSDGNPFFVFEILRDLRERDLVAMKEDGTLQPLRGLSAVDVPTSVRSVLSSRLTDLRKAEREFLDVAAVQGFAFDADLIARVLKRERLEVLQSLAEVERRGGIVRGTGAGFEFDHHLLQEVIYDELPELLRCEYHVLLAEAHEECQGLRGASPSDLPGVEAVFLAGHFLRGGRAERAAPLVLRALEHLAASYHADAVLELASLAIEALGDDRPALRCDLRLRQAECLDLIGRRGAQRAAVEDAVTAAKLASDTGRLAIARCMHGWLLLWLSHYDEAERVLGDALDDARAVSDKATEARVISNLGLVLLQRGRVEEARDHHRRDLAICRSIDDRRGEGRASINLGLVDLRLGEPEEARSHLELSLSIFQEVGHRQGEVLALANLGRAACARGRLEWARRQFERAVALCRQIGYRHGEAHSLVSMVPQVCLGEGRIDEAAERVTACQDLVRALNARDLTVKVSRAAGELAVARGEHEAAKSHFEESLGLARELGADDGVARAALALGKQLATLGSEGPALEQFREARALAREISLREVEVLAAAHLAAHGEISASDVKVEEGLPVIARVEVLLMLHVSGSRSGELASARALLEESAAHLKGEDQEAFWSSQVLARAVAAAETTAD